jgi:DMSO/TMAO reductase YedYZ molybdopterin-dependent catalytic subunit
MDVDRYLDCDEETESAQGPVVCVDNEGQESPRVEVSKETKAASELNVRSEDPVCASASLSHLDDELTPTRRFFIRNHFDIPRLDVSSWALSIWGEVERPFMLRLEDLKALPRKEMVCLLECAGNSRSVMYPPAEGVPWDHGAVGTARWAGVPLAAVLEQASLRPNATDVLFEGADYGKERTAPGVLAPTECSYAMSLPLANALHPDTMLAYEMNGESLPAEHGYPVRLLVPNWYGMASVKWLANIRVLNQPFRGFHENDYYVFLAEGATDSPLGQRVTTIRVKSLITWPARGWVIPTGRHQIRGVAWSGQGTISRLEVSTDDGRSWHAGVLQEAQSPHAWRRWHYLWEVRKPGYYLIRAKATDAKGNTQPPQAPWNFRGYAVNSIHTVPVTVRPGD